MEYHPEETVHEKEIREAVEKHMAKNADVEWVTIPRLVATFIVALVVTVYFNGF